MIMYILYRSRIDTPTTMVGSVAGYVAQCADGPSQPFSHSTEKTASSPLVAHL